VGGKSQINFRLYEKGSDMGEKTRKQQLEEMLAEDPNDPFLRYGLAMEHAGAGAHEEAAGCLGELIRLHPDYVPAYFHAGKSLLALGRDGAAQEVLRAGIAAALAKGDGHAAGEMEQLLDSIG
jgi:thioredoxin-like negative regulator of GroEL